MEQETVKGRVKYSKTSCYLCSEWLDDNDVEEHLLHCRQQVTECPNRCGAIVFSALLQLHLNTCRASYGELEASEGFFIGTTMASEKQADGDPMFTDMIESLEETQRKMKLIIADCFFRVYHTQHRLDALAKEATLPEDPSLKAYQVALAHTYQQESVNNETLVKIRETWTRAGLLENCPGCSNPKPETLDECSEPQPKTSKESSEPQPKTSKESSEPQPKKSKEVGQRADVLNSDKTSTAQPTTSKMGDDVAVPTTEPLLQERVRTLEQQVARYRQETYYTKQRLDDLQDHVLMNVYNSGLASTNGRIIWRIDNFEQRFANAKENGVLMRGPIFSNSQYGYILQIETGLDGVGAWRGRNMVVGLSMQSGPFDSLLQWPYQLQGTFILHNQSAERSAPNNVWKTFTLALEKVPGQRQFFVHIPHHILHSESYIHNDAIIMEMVIYPWNGEPAN